MEPITYDKIQDICSQSSIKVADPSIGIGRELTYINPPLRTLVFQFVESDPLEYVAGAVALILDIEEEWLLFPRYGNASDLQLLVGKDDFAAILVKASERPSLVNYLCTRPTSREFASADLYVVSKSGNILITWDHHTAREGLSVKFQQIQDASSVLVALNEFGAELEVYYVNR